MRRRWPGSAPTAAPGRARTSTVVAEAQRQLGRRIEVDGVDDGGPAPIPLHGLTL